MSVQVRTAETAETAEIAEIAETANQQTEELGHGYEFRGRGVESREPRLWEEPRKTTVSSPVRAARLAGRQVPSIERRRAVKSTKVRRCKVGRLRR